MPDNQNQNLTIDIKEINALLCPKCQLALKMLLAEKIAEKAIKE